MGNGELLIVLYFVRNGSLWSDVIFKKEVIFHEFDFKTSELDFVVSKSSMWKPTTLCDEGVFSFIIISQLRFFTGLIFYEYVEIHQVRRLVFGSYL